jgi:hypothetical protein
VVLLLPVPNGGEKMINCALTFPHLSLMLSCQEQRNILMKRNKKLLDKIAPILNWNEIFISRNEFFSPVSISYTQRYHSARIGGWMKNCVKTKKLEILSHFADEWS